MLADGWDKQLIPEDQFELLQIGRTEEMEQPLIELAYLKDGVSLTTAIRQFRKDYQALNLLADEEISAAQKKIIQQLDDKLDGVELNLIHTLTSLDGDFEIKILPQLGEQNLITRIIHYRLDIYGLYDDEIDAPFSVKCMDGIERLKGWIHFNKPALDLIDLIGNFQLLLATVLHKGELNRRVVVFDYDNTSTSPALLSTVRSLEEQDDDEQDDEHDDEDRLEKLEKDALRICDKVHHVINKVPTPSPSNELLIARSLQELPSPSENVQQKMEDALDELKRSFQESLATTGEATAELKTLQSSQNRLEFEKNNIDHQISLKEDQLKTFKKNRKEIDKLNKDIEKLKQQFKDKNNVTITVLRIRKVELPKNIKRAEARLATLRKRKEKRRFNRKINIIRDQLKKVDKQLQEWKKIEEKEQQLFELQSTNIDGKEALIQVALEALKEKRNKNKAALKIQKKAIKAKEKEIEKLTGERIKDQEKRQKELQGLQSELRGINTLIGKVKLRFRVKLKKYLDRDKFKEIKTQIFKNKNEQYLSDIVDFDLYNKFLIRLIQVYQWTNGYYFGKLDSQLQDRTYESIVELIEDVPGLRLPYILHKLGNVNRGYWVLNIHYFIKKMVDHLEEDKKEYTTADVIKLYEDNFSGSELQNKDAERAWKEFTQESKEGLKETGVIRRVYFGVKSLAKSIFRTFKKLFKFIIKGIKKLVTLFKNFIKLLYREIREAWIKFKQGMSFLFGKRTLKTVDPVSNKLILTKYDFDFDALMYAHPMVSETAIKTHVKLCLSRTRNLRFAAILTGKIIRWFLYIKGPGGWARLAIRLALEFKRLILRWLRRNIKIKKIIIRKLAT